MTSQERALELAREACPTCNHLSYDKGHDAIIRALLSFAAEEVDAALERAARTLEQHPSTYGEAAGIVRALKRQPTEESGGIIKP